MGRIPFSEDELKVVGEIPGFFPGMPGTPIYDFPVTPREAFLRLLRRDPVWQTTLLETKFFNPSVIPDNVARAFVFEAVPLERDRYGGMDMFGIEWDYVEVAGGSMVKPGSTLLNDANEWEEKVVFPEVDSWDWEGSARTNEEYLDHNFVLTPNIMTGYFERLISFMDFDRAVMALIDEDQKEAVKALFENLTEVYIKIVDNLVEYFKVDVISVHDDWGSQRAPFFSPGTTMEMIVPAMKRLTDHIHAKGLVADLHSCGHLEMLVPSIIAAGWDSWNPQAMNDTHMIYEKYGDQLIVAVIPDPVTPDSPEKEQRAAAEKFADNFCSPQKPAAINMYGMMSVTPVFREELYRQSRIKFGGE